MKSTLTLDSSGVFLSSLCLVHCLLLPLMGTALPIAGALSENALIHQALVVIAVPIAMTLIINPRAKTSALLASFGISALILGAFVEALHDHEKMITIIGAAGLSFAHLSNMWGRRHSH